MKRILFIALSLLSLTTYAQRQITIGTPGSTPTTSLTYTATGTPFDAVGARGLDQRITTNATNTASLSSSVSQLQSQTANAGTGSPYTRAVQVMRGIGSLVQLETMAGTYYQATQNNIGVGTGLSLVPLEANPQAMTLTSATTFISNVAAYTTTQGDFFAVYSYNTGNATYTRLGQTASGVSLFKPSAAGFVTASFQSPIAIPANCNCYLGMIHNQENQTTAPLAIGFSTPNGNNEVRNKLPGTTTYNAGFTFDSTPPATITFSQLAGSSTFRGWIAVN